MLMNRVTIIIFLIFCIGLIPVRSNAQNVARIQIGDLWDSPDGLEAAIGLQGLYMIWPGGHEKGGSLYEGGFRTNSTGARLRFLFKDFEVEEKDSNGNIVNTRIVPFYHPSYALKTKTEGYRPTQVKNMRTARTTTTVIYEDGTVHQNLVDKQGPYLIEKPTLISDELIEYTEYFYDGFYVKQSYYAWANPFHDDYIIRVVDIVNNGNQDDNIFTSEITPKDLKKLYLDLYVNNFSPNNKGEGYYSFQATGTWDNWHDYYGDVQNDSVRFMYAFDGDDPNVPGDDQGDPFPSQFSGAGFDPSALYSAGEFVSGMYAGYGVLYANSSATNALNDYQQPYSYGYDSFTAAPGWREELRWANVYNNGSRNFKHPDYSKTVPKNLESCWMAFGPYDLPAYGKLRLVFVHAVNGPSIAACKDIGNKYLRQEITKAQKDSFLLASKEILKTTIKRAQWNWDNYLSKNKSIPNAPKPPTGLKVTSGIKSIKLEWDKSKSTDVFKYNIYRKSGTNLGDFEKIKDVASTDNVFIDSLLDIGVSYYYYVTAANDGTINIDPSCFHQPLESSKYINRSYYPARAYREASINLSGVRVVPNPYNLYQAKTFPGDADRITFTNLSHHCTIRIFTINGDLIKTIHKDDVSSYVAWNPMLTDDNLFIAPDIYIYHVEDRDTGQKVTGKFVVVR
jgi:hypothetical protein